MHNIGQAGCFEFLTLRFLDGGKTTQFRVTTRGHYSKKVVTMNGVTQEDVHALVKHDEAWMRYKFKMKSKQTGFELEPSNDSLFEFTLTFH